MFEVCHKGDFIPGSRWLSPMWVDIKQKSRLTSADLMSKYAPEGRVHCPPPSLSGGRVLRSLATMYKLGMVVFGVASACLHAPEAWRFHGASEEWAPLMAGYERKNMIMCRWLYGRQTAGAFWRD